MSDKARSSPLPRCPRVSRQKLFTAEDAERAELFKILFLSALGVLGGERLFDGACFLRPAFES
jgi:hypothetical protein